MSRIEVIKKNQDEIPISREKVFKLLGSSRDTMSSDEYDELVRKVTESLEPAAALAFAPWQDGEALLLTATLGGKVSAFIDSCFKNGEYLKGLMADAIASTALFSFEESLHEKIREMCRLRHCGIKSRIDLPGTLSMEAQKTVFDLLNAGKTLGISLTDHYMFDPVKTCSVVFPVTEDESIMCISHNCDGCSAKNCGLRKEASMSETAIRVKNKSDERMITAGIGSNLMEILRSNGIEINAFCGGKGRCGKCAVKITGTVPPAGNSDIRNISKEALEKGYRLSCKAIVSGPCLVEIPDRNDDDTSDAGAEGVVKEKSISGNISEAGIAIDIGTTTLAFSLLDLKDGSVISTCTALNSERSFGADVLSRIEGAAKGKADELNKLITSDLEKGIAALITENGIEADRIKRACISGNTTMLHLLLKYDTKGLGAHPFTPVSIAMEERHLKELLKEGSLSKELGDVPVFLPPGISAFVGADIVSGLYYLNFHENEKICALIDLGTNGEMAIGNKDRIMTSSTAAGPAFEGGKIRWGTTLIETAADLLRSGLMDDTGVLSDPYFDEGYPVSKEENGEEIFITMDNIRELQLAKSAVRAGFETLLLRYGASYSDIDRLYIAGGFGFYLDMEKAARISLIPEELVVKSEAVGNTSLKGAVSFLSDPGNAKEAVTKIAERAETIELSSDKDFNRMYMEYMMF